MKTLQRMSAGVTAGAALFLVFVGPFAARGASTATSDRAFVFLRPEESSFWRTATNSVMTLPLFKPEAATSAILTISGLGYYMSTNVSADSVTVSLPAPVAPEEENVYDMTLEFDDGTVRTAKLGLVEGLLPPAQGGSTRCRLASSGRQWQKAVKRAVVPIPYGTTSISVTKSTGGTTEAALDGAQGWHAVDGIVAGTTYSLVLDDGEGLPLAFGDVLGISYGFLFICR